MKVFMNQEINNALNRYFEFKDEKTENPNDLDKWHQEERIDEV